MYTFDEKFKKGADRAFRAQQGLTAFLSGLNRILPEPPGFKTEKPKDKREDTIRIADTAGDSWYLGFSERSITPPDIDAKNYYIGGNLSAFLDDIRFNVYPDEFCADVTLFPKISAGDSHK